jgi:hypothetical protein
MTAGARCIHTGQEQHPANVRGRQIVYLNPLGIPPLGDIAIEALLKCSAKLSLLISARRTGTRSRGAH